MITLLNHESNNWDKYNVLFKKAWKYLLRPDPEQPTKTLLKSEDKEAADDGKEAFSNLAHYFSYIKELISHDPLYLMLPIDEAPFEINANTREIKIPADFAKCSGVQSDNYAEIVTFTIDRYFDYKDLDTADIAVQWVNEASGTEGVSFIQLKDLETYGDENKIRFGWPLTSEMTAAAGNLRFAVRFYTSQTDSQGVIKFNYLFNTSPASIPIKPTLSIDFNSADIVRKDNDLALFSSYIKNSMNPSYGIPTPIQFILEEEEFPQYGRIRLSDDSFELKAQGITKDLNELSYEWYRENSDGSVSKLTDDDVTYNISFNYELYAPNSWPKERPVITFWVEEIKEGVLGYVPYREEWPEKNPNNLFIRKAVLSFLPKGGDVTGKYYIKAINQITDKNGEVINKTEQMSRVCYILSPAEINITTNLSEHMFLDENSNALTIELQPDSARPQRFYNIYKKATSFEAKDIANMTPININPETKKTEPIAIAEGVNTISYPLEDGAFGYYALQPISKLNRVTKDNVYSKICYVSDNPIKPVGVMWVDGINPLTIDADQDEIPDVSGTLHSQAIFEWIDGINSGYLTINATGSAGQEMVLKVARSTSNETDYNVGEIAYKWTRTLEGATEEISKPTNSEGDIIEIKDNELKIRVLKPETGRYTYTCKIFNKIADVEVESDEYTFTIT